MNNVQCEFLKELSILCYKYNIDSIKIQGNSISIESNDYLLQFIEFNRKLDEMEFSGITTYDGKYSIDINVIKQDLIIYTKICIKLDFMHILFYNKRGVSI